MSQYKKLLNESLSMRNDALFTDSSGRKQFSWNGENSIGGDFDAYREEQEQLAEEVKYKADELYQQGRDLRQGLEVLAADTRDRTLENAAEKVTEALEMINTHMRNA
jgi:hypothetical protein